MPALDGVRGMAILSVMIYHLTLVQGANSFDHAILAVAQVGWIGVDLFFVLSGFLITGLLYDAKDADHYFRNFYARRTLRIFPLYYAVVFVTLVVLPRIPHPKAATFVARLSGDEIWYWIYLSNFSIAQNGWRHPVLDISWSLAIEEQFYLIWPAVVLACSRRTLMRICAALVIIALVVRGATVASGAHWINNYVMTPARMDGLAVGSFVALAARSYGSLSALIPIARRATPLLALTVLALFLVCGHNAFENPLFQILGYTMLQLFLGCAFVLAISASPRGSWVGRRLAGPFLISLGKYSYALYLFHLIVRPLVRDLIFDPSDVRHIGGTILPAQLLFYAIAGTLTFAAAFASWHLYEKHFLKLKDYFRTERPRPSAQSASIVETETGEAVSG